jgi:hypothetical protein
MVVDYREEDMLAALPRVRETEWGMVLSRDPLATGENVKEG